MSGFFIIAAIIGIVCVMWWTVRNERGARSFALSAFQGIAAMFAVNLTGLITGVTVAVNWYTLAACIVLGLPGVIGMVTLDFIL